MTDMITVELAEELLPVENNEIPDVCITLTLHMLIIESLSHLWHDFHFFFLFNSWWRWNLTPSSSVWVRQRSLSDLVCWQSWKKTEMRKLHT